MKILIISVGKKHDKNLREAIVVYEKRLKKFCDLSWDIVPSSNIDNESSQIEKRITPDDYIVLLDETGQALDNDDLAQLLEDQQNLSTKRVVFIIGGPFGVNYGLISKANLVLSFSSLVFPHQLVRLMLVEQLYRSYSIISGTKYHHE